jgi:hypothetical protein
MAKEEDMSLGSWLMVLFYIVVLGGGSAVLLAHALKNKDNV